MNTETKFTPGPWLPIFLEKGTPQTVNGRTHSTLSQKEIRIACASGEILKLKTFVAGLHGDEQRLVTEDEANARLIAAAPALFEALDCVLNDCESYINDEDGPPARETFQAMRETITAALAKATAESEAGR